MTGPDLPAPEEPFDFDAYLHRWPSGAENTELLDGVLVFSGRFDGRDVRTAQGAYPGRQVLLNDDGGIEIHPASPTPPRPVHERFLGAQHPRLG